jgi:hypothetical protein
MKMKKINFLITVISVLLVSCTEIDNYPIPNCAIKGQIIDSETGEPFESRIADNIALVRVREDNPKYSNPTYFDLRIMEKGTFAETALPETAYKFYLQKVPMVSTDTIRVQLSPTTPQNVVIKGIPYLRIALEVARDSMFFTITKPSSVTLAGNITEINLMYGSYSRVNEGFTNTLDNTLAAFVPPGGATQANVLNKTFILPLKTPFPTITSGKHYFRVCARLSGAPSERRNYSPTIEAEYLGQ